MKDDEKELLEHLRAAQPNLQKGIRTPDIKKRTHDVFDTLWKDGPCTRPEAYVVLMQVLGIFRFEDAHIHSLSEQQCRQLINAIQTGRYSITRAKEVYRKWQYLDDLRIKHRPFPEVVKAPIWQRVLHSLQAKLLLRRSLAASL